MVRYWLAEAPAKETRVELEFQDAEGKLLRRFDRKDLLPKDSKDSRDEQRYVLEPKAGLNLFAWPLATEGARRLTGTAMWNGNLSGPRVPPGEYRVVLRVGDVEQRMPCEVRIDPRATASLDEHRAQFAFLREIVDRLDAIHAALLEARRVRGALRAVAGKLPESVAGEELKTACEATCARIDELEKQLCQPLGKSAQDPLNFPIGLNDKLAALNAASGGFGPTAQDVLVRDELLARIQEPLAALERLLADDVPALESKAREVGAPVIR
ncbi:MAG: hypothetical protein HZB39_00875 [Planctomycetes bacterium]|nr:hypothetical protein [Planctomycetota bacterium]